MTPDSFPDHKSFTEYGYSTAHKARPRGPGGTDVAVDIDDKAVVAAILNFLILHATATEASVRRLADAVDNLEKKLA
jgi:hypothetical protein